MCCSKRAPVAGTPRFVDFDEDGLVIGDPKETLARLERVPKLKTPIRNIWESERPCLEIDSLLSFRVSGVCLSNLIPIFTRNLGLKLGQCS